MDIQTDIIKQGEFDCLIREFECREASSLDSDLGIDLRVEFFASRRSDGRSCGRIVLGKEAFG